MEQARSLCLGESEWAPIRALKRVLAVLSLPVASTTTILGPSQTVKTQGARHASPTLAKEKMNEKRSGQIRFGYVICFNRSPRCEMKAHAKR